MTKIKLFGELGKKYGAEHNLFLDKLSEFGAAMEANFNGFRKFFIDSIQDGKEYCVVVDGIMLKNESELKNKLKKIPQEIAVVPLLAGAVYAVAAAITSFVLGAGAVGTATYLVVQTVISLVLYAVVSAVVSALFAPKPKSNFQASTANAGLNSYYFSGRTNKAQQGTPVPIVYGELKIGSYVIQAGIRNLDKDDFAELNNGSGSGEPTGSFI